MLFLLYVLVFFGHEGCGILVPRPGVEPSPPALEALSLNHWIARGIPGVTFCMAFHACLKAGVQVCPERWQGSLAGTRMPESRAGILSSHLPALIWGPTKRSLALSVVTELLFEAQVHVTVNHWMGHVAQLPPSA